MPDDDLERALGGEPDIVPSSGFVSTVMAAVHQEAEAPAPLAFPWGRALSGAALAFLTAFVIPAIVLMRSSPIPSVRPESVSTVLDLVRQVGQDRDLWTMIAALLLTTLLVGIPRRLAARTH